MKTLSLVLKILAAAAVIAGIIFVIMVYGDKIVAWFKKLLGCFTRNDCVCDDCDCVIDPDDEESVVASDNDFEG